MKNLILTFALALSLTNLFAQKAIYVETTGKGNPVLYLPGFISPGSVWNETVVATMGNYENHLVSYAGFNGLTPIEMPWYSTLNDELIEYISKNDLKNLTIIGHSMGGNLAIDLAAALPEYVTGLILVESVPCMRELMMPGVPAEAIQYASPYNQQIIAMDDPAFKQMVLQQSSYMTYDSLKVAQIADWSLEADRTTYVFGYTDLLKLDLRTKLENIKAPALILGADALGAEVVKNNLEKQYENLKSKEIYIASNSRHFIMFDQPEWLNDKINTFLQNDK